MAEETDGGSGGSDHPRSECLGLDSSPVRGGEWERGGNGVSVGFVFSI